MLTVLQESALDYVFIRLGLDTQTVEHPVIMTERICAPLHSRQRMLPHLCSDSVTS